MKLICYKIPWPTNNTLVIRVKKKFCYLTKIKFTIWH